MSLADQNTFLVLNSYGLNKAVNINFIHLILTPSSTVTADDKRITFRK